MKNLYKLDAFERGYELKDIAGLIVEIKDLDAFCEALSGWNNKVNWEWCHRALFDKGIYSVCFPMFFDMMEDLESGMEQLKEGDTDLQLGAYDYIQISQLGEFKFYSFCKYTHTTFESNWIVIEHAKEVLENNRLELWT